MHSMPRQPIGKSYKAEKMKRDERPRNSDLCHSKIRRTCMFWVCRGSMQKFLHDEVADEVPRSQEVERKYAQFLHDEGVCG